MGFLHLRLLGGFEAELASGVPVHIPAKKARGLLAYLALRPGQTQSRARLADLLWSDRDDAHGHNSLRQALTGLRKTLGDVDPPLLYADRESVAIEPAALQVDAMTFEQLLHGETSDDLERAAELYQGALLDGIGIQDPVFEDWLRDERVRFHDLANHALTDTLGHLTDSGQWERAIEVAQRLLELDPFQESVHRNLMGLYAEAGERKAALRQFQVCRTLLDRELGVRPEAETEQLFQAIREGHPTSGHTRASVKVEPEIVNSRVDPPSDNPSIAVLPFANRGGGPKEDDTSDRIAENIVTDLLRFSDLKVIACSLDFRGKGQDLQVADLAHEYGARYVVDGSIQRSGKHVRVSAKLIDTATNTYVWAERYDREWLDSFATLDEITRQIVGTLGGIWGEVYRAEFKRIDRNPPENDDPYAFYVRGLESAGKFTKDATAKARQSFERAIRLNPGSSSAFAELARAHYLDYWYEWSGNPSESLASAETAARKAVSLNFKDADARYALGMVHFAGGRHDQAIAEFKAAIALNPNYPLVKSQLGEVLASMGRVDEALALIEEAMTYDPLKSEYYLGSLGYACFVARDYEKAVDALSKRSSKIDSPTSRLVLAASYARLGRDKEAGTEVAHVLETCPGMTVERCVDKEPYTNPDDREHLRDALRKAGLPERGSARK